MKISSLHLLRILMFCFHPCACVDDGDGLMTAAIKVKTRIFDPKVYDPVVRPTDGSSTLTHIRVYILPSLIAHVGLSMDNLEISFFHCMSWLDTKLCWNNTEDDMGYVFVSPESIWMPDLTLLNANPNQFQSINSQVNIHHDGSITFCAMITATVPCTMDTTGFPHDTHDCTLQFVSLSYSDAELEYKIDYRTADVNNVSSEWDVQEVSHKKGRVLNQTSIDLTVRLRRKGNVYPYTLTLPSVALTLVTLSIFWMPQTSDRRVTVGLFSLLATSELLMWTTFSLPSTVFVPRYMIFIGTTILVQVIVIGFSVMTINIVTCAVPRQPPDLLTRFLRGPASKVLCLSTSMNEARSPQIDLRPQEEEDETTSKDTSNRCQQDWYMIAQCVDRLLFVVFAIILVALQV